MKKDCVLLVGRGHWTVNYTSTQSFNNYIILFVGSKTLVTLIEWFQTRSVNTFKPIVLTTEDVN